MAAIAGTSLDDVLLTTVDADAVSASGGNDIILIGDGFHDLGETVNGGGGYDRIWFTASVDGQTLTLLSGVTAVEAVLMADAAGRTAGTADLIIDASAVTTGLLLVGNDGDNTITGTAKDDVIVGNGGADTLLGGLGRDRIVIRVNEATVDTADGGALAEGNTLVLHGVAAGAMVVDLSAAGDQLIINAVAGSVQQNFSHLDASHVRAFGVQVTGSDLANTIIGSGLADTIAGGAGNDVLTGGGANDVFLVEAGNYHKSAEIIGGGAGTDVLRFTANDTLLGATLVLSSRVVDVERVEIADAAGSTLGTTALNVSAASVKQALTLVGNDGANRITGTAKDDFITGNLGIDNLSGGSGNDRFVFEDDDGESDALETIAGGSGDEDFIVFTSTDAGDTLVLGAKVSGIEGVYFSEIATDETLAVNGATALHVNASAATAGLLFMGNSGTNSITGGAGADTIVGGGGVDTVLGNAGADVIELDAAALDDADAGLASEGNMLRLIGSAAALLDVNLSLENNQDQVAGGGTQADFTHVDASEMTGANGVRITASGRTNKLTGSDRNDVFVINRPVDLVTTAGVSDVIDGGDDVDDTDGDILRFASSGATSALRTLTLTSKVTGVEKVEIADADGVTTGIQVLNVDARGSTAKLSILGNDGKNRIDGTKFDDTLNGNLGADTLLGGGGNDVYEFDDPLDFASGDTITDTASEVGDNDVVRFTSTDDGEMLVLRNSIAGIETYEVGEDAGDVGIDASNVTKFGVNMLGNEANNHLIGTDLADTIEGGDGADTLDGGGGADRIVLNVNDAADVADAGLKSEKNWLVLKSPVDAGPVAVFVDVSSDTLDADQITNIGGVQSGFLHVDASGMLYEDPDPNISPLGVEIIGGDEANHFIGSSSADRFRPGLGKDTVEGGAGSKGDTWIVGSQAEYDGDIYSDIGSSTNDFIQFDPNVTNADSVAKRTLIIRDNVFGVDAAGAGANSFVSTLNLNLDARLIDHPFGLSGNLGNNLLQSTRHGESLFDTGGVDTMEGGLGDDDYTMVTDTAWVFVEDGMSINDDRITDTGGIDHFYHASGGSNTIVIGNRVSGIEIFGVTGGLIKPSGVFRRDVETTTDGGIDAHHVNHAITLGGNWGNNELIATAFNDTIFGHKGQDTIEAGAGTDHITMDVSDGTVYQIDAGAESENNLLFITGEAEEQIRFDLSQATNQITHIGAAAEGQTQSGLRHIDASAMSGDSGIAVLFAGSAANKLTGSNQDDVLEGGGGRDKIAGGGGNDAIVLRRHVHMVTDEKADAGSGDADAIWFAWDNVVGNSRTLKPDPQVFLGIEVLMAADDTGATTGTDALNLDGSLFTTALKIVGNDGANKLTGTAKNDTLIGNDGADSLTGASGNDVFLYEDASESTGDTINGGGGVDTLRFASTIPGALLQLGAGVSAVEVAEVTGDEAIGIDASAIASESVRLTMLGNAADNSLYGGAGNDTIFGDLGNDSLRGGGGGDSFETTLEADDFDDIDAGATSDTGGNSLKLSGEATGDMVWDLASGGQQFVSMNGAAPGRQISGITHLDLSQVTEGAATITGTAELNRLVGTGLDDTFIVLEIDDFAVGEVIAGGAGDDQLVLTATLGGLWTLTNKVTGIESVLVDTAGAPDVDIHAGAVANALKIEANDGDNVITGTSKGDTIIGHAGADSITAGGGADQVKTDIAVEDAIHAGGNSEGNEWFLEGAATGAMAFDLNLSGDQLTIGGVAGLVQRGFMHINAAGVTGFSVNITGSGAANRLAGGAEQDTIVGGLGADTIGMDVTGGYDEIDAGLVAEGNELRLTGDASEVQFVNLALNGDQLTTGAGTQSGFMHFDASAMELFGVNVTGSAAGNRITGTAMQDTILGGLGADIVTMDVAAYDQIDAGNGSEGDVLRLVGTASGSFTVDLGVAAGGDQLLLIDAAAEAVVQSDFQHLDVAKLSGGFGVVARGSGANNNLTGTAFQDRFTGRAGADLIDLGADPVTGLSDGEEDRVFYESVADGATAAAAAVSRDRIVHFDAGQDRVVFVGEFNITGADTDTNSANLDDIENNDSFVFAVNERANFSVEDEAMFLGAATAKLTDADLYGGGLVNLTARINAVGVSAVAGDDGLIVVQGKKTTGIYYYQELAGGGVQANELTVLGIIDKLVQQNDFEFG